MLGNPERKLRPIGTVEKECSAGSIWGRLQPSRDGIAFRPTRKKHAARHTVRREQSLGSQ